MRVFEESNRKGRKGAQRFFYKNVIRLSVAIQSPLLGGRGFRGGFLKNSDFLSVMFNNVCLKVK
jgi:hypothetical protein